MLEHGGRLRQAARHYGIAMEEWLDLSTGINPDAWPVPALDLRCWNRLPEEDDGLEEAAAAYYGNPRLLPLAGSQAAIQALPSLFEPLSVACVSPLYGEHPHAWQRAGHRVLRLSNLQDALAAATPVVLLCNPNNPTARTLPRAALLAALETLHQRSGWLIIDEAFADAEPENALVDLAGSEAAPQLVVLRSLGKFFGLAGARVGFLFAADAKRNALREKLGPWPLSHPSREIARQALEDTAWQAKARQQLCEISQRLAALLAPLGEVSRNALFCTLKTPQPAALYDYFARHAILLRRFDEHGLLRFGLPENAAGWQRLTQVLQTVRTGANCGGVTLSK